MATTFENAVKSSAVMIYAKAWHTISHMPEEVKKEALMCFVESAWNEDLYKMTKNGFLGNPRDEGDAIEERYGENGPYVRTAYELLMDAFCGGRKTYTHNNPQLRRFLNAYEKGRVEEAPTMASKFLGRTDLASNIEDNYNDDSNHNDDSDKKITKIEGVSRLPSQQTAMNEDRDFSLKIASEPIDTGLKYDEQMNFREKEWYPFVAKVFRVENCETQLGKKTQKELEIIFGCMNGRKIDDWRKYTMKSILEAHRKGEFNPQDTPRPFSFAVKE
jgi:hypothetical protein